jgi:hypothetical protein
MVEKPSVLEQRPPPEVAKAAVRRGRKPRAFRNVQPTAVEGGSLEVRVDEVGGATILRIHGALDPESVLVLRDIAFTAIGARPDELCVDIELVNLPLGKVAMETLVTISRVARLVNVRYSVIVSPSLESLWRKAGLERVMPMQSVSKYSVAAMKAAEAVGVYTDGVL